MPTNPTDTSWQRVGSLDELHRRELQPVTIGGRPLALSFKDGKFGLIAGRCLHAGGPLGEGKLAGENVVCPWHGWSFNRCDGKSGKGYPIAVASYELKAEDGALWVRFDTATQVKAPQREPHRLARPVKREPGPIRWGAASSLYFKLAERMNCVQNQITINNRELIRNKVASFIITGGQDNVQGVAGQMLAFFSELGFTFPQFPFVAHSRGWTAEDMENNARFVQSDAHLREGTRELVARAVNTASGLLAASEPARATSRGGRKASAASK